MHFDIISIVGRKEENPTRDLLKRDFHKFFETNCILKRTPNYASPSPPTCPRFVGRTRWSVVSDLDNTKKKRKENPTMFTKQV